MRCVKTDSALARKTVSLLSAGETLKNIKALSSLHCCVVVTSVRAHFNSICVHSRFRLDLCATYESVCDLRFR